MSVSVDDFIKKVKMYNPDGINIVRKAYELAYNLHKGQYRQSGEEYIIHPLTVAYILADMHVDTDTLCAALLHDTVEDTDITLDEIRELFNDDVCLLVDGVTKISRMNFSSEKDLVNANIRKIVTGITKDIRIIIIKLADRLHNMRTLGFKRPSKQLENAQETLDIYVNLAYNIGAYRIKNELEDLSFKYINDYEYNRIFRARNKIIFKNENVINDMVNEIRYNLEKIDIDSDIYVIYKNIYGIYKRLINSNNNNINDIHDLCSVVLNVSNVGACYMALGCIHSLYFPINYHFKDYICRPKTNMYRSIHTTVFGKNNMLLQAQIRTYEMDKIDNNGISAYWDIYKGNARMAMQEDIEKKYQFFDSLVELDNMFPNNDDFAMRLSDELFSDKVYVYGGNGNVMEMPVGSTVVDYVYKIGGDVSNLFGAWVNDEIVGLDYVLKNGDRVVAIDNEYIGGIKVSWEDFVKTSLAKKKIREFKGKSYY